MRFGIIRFVKHPVLFSLTGAIGIALAVAFIVFRPDSLRGYTAPGFVWLTPLQAAQSGAALAPSLLAVVYEAFEETEESAVYDRLAEVSAGAALEALYLERIGAMLGGGLERSDQEIHEMEVVRLDTVRAGSTVRMDATWQVIGTVGHSEHVHVRGNTYSAILTVEPVEGAWRITGFELTEVDRSDAGSYVAPAAE